MSLNEYNKARKAGELSYRESLNSSRYPYVGVLDEMLSHVNIISENNLGLQEIPMDLIAGTYTAGRRTAFAPNFMPLLPENTEFAGKWSNLIDSLKEEGLQDPIKAYEYMNRFYVMEGNKRVSVMKFLGAVSVPGTVIRLIPERNESEASITYFEYLEFYKRCPENYMIFTKPGSYARFLSLAKKGADQVWDDEEKSTLKSLFYRFRQAAASLDEEFLNHEVTGDAFLAYLNIYPYQEAMKKSMEELVKDIRSMKEELLFQDSDRSVKLLLNEDEAPKQSIFGIFSRQGTGNRVLHVDFIHDHDVHTSSWTYLHELGKNHVENYFKEKVVTRSFYNVQGPDETEAVLEKCGRDGSDIVFVTSRLFLKGALTAAVKYPKTRFLCCTLNAAHRYIRTYYARLFEVKFLSGVIAGSMAENNKIGYIADIPIPAHIANLNAFALGVQMIRPAAKIYLQWLHQKETEPTEFFRRQSVHLISGRDMINFSAPNPDYGLYQLEDGVRTELALTVLNWGLVYQKIIESVQNGAFDEAQTNENSMMALNYWWGIPTEAVDLFYSRSIPPQTARHVEVLRNVVKNGSLKVFSGEMMSQTGPVTTEGSSLLTPSDILNMDWLLNNIEGSIPAYDELTEYAKSLITAHNN